MIVFLLIVTASFSPAEPTVGDRISVNFGQPVVLDRSDAYEVVSQAGGKVVVRTFRPEPFGMSGTVGAVRFRRLMVPVKSILAADDRGQPAPLKPPRGPRTSREPLVAMAIAGAAALLFWAAVFRLARRATDAALAVPELPAAERFRLTVALLREGRETDRWAALADATRRYLAEIEPSLGLELTTAETLRTLRRTNIAAQEVVTTILRQGDLEKFSPWGANATDFDTVAAGALELIPETVMEEAA